MEQNFCIGLEIGICALGVEVRLRALKEGVKSLGKKICLESKAKARDVIF